MPQPFSNENLDLTLPNRDLYDAKSSGGPHLSVGVVLLDHILADRPNVALMYSPPGVENPWGSNFKTLVRETLIEGETLEQGVGRGLEEEVGARGRIVAFLGSTVVTICRDGIQTQKTTLYHLVELVGTTDDELRDKADIEGRLSVVWEALDEAIKWQVEQGARPEFINRPDLDESDPLILARKYIQDYKTREA